MSILGDKIKNFIEENIEQENKTYSLLVSLLPALEKFEGKKITKEIETELQNWLLGQTNLVDKVRISSVWHEWTLKIYLNKYTEIIRTTLSHDDIYKQKDFILCLKSFQDRVIAKKKELAIINFQALVDDYSNACMALQKLEEDLELFTDKDLIKEFLKKEMSRFPGWLKGA